MNKARNNIYTKLKFLNPFEIICIYVHIYYTPIKN